MSKTVIDVNIASRRRVTRDASGLPPARPVILNKPTPKSFWSYQAPTPGGPPPGFKGDWTSLSPGMRREILRDYEKHKGSTGDAGEFKEGKHPRDSNGKFARGMSDRAHAATHAALSGEELSSKHLDATNAHGAAQRAHYLAAQEAGQRGDPMARYHHRVASELHEKAATRHRWMINTRSDWKGKRPEIRKLANKFSTQAKERSDKTTD